MFTKYNIDYMGEKCTGVEWGYNGNKRYVLYVLYVYSNEIFATWHKSEYDDFTLALNDYVEYVKRADCDDIVLLIDTKTNKILFASKK